MNTACKDGLTPEKESDLGALRAQLDRIDAELQTLFERRMALCGPIGDYKKEHALAVRDAARTAERPLRIKRACFHPDRKKPKLRQAASAFLRLSLGCQYGRFVVY